MLSLVYFVCLVCLVIWLNETNQINKTNQINQTNQLLQSDRGANVDQ